ALWPFASDSPWNHPLGSDAQYAHIDSPGVDNRGSATINVTAWSHPVFLARTSDPRRTVTLRDGGPPLATIHVPVEAKPDPRADGHLHIIDPRHQLVTELFQADLNHPDKIIATSAIRNSLSGPGVFATWNGVRAYGGSALGGLIRQGELTSGIRHALAVAVRRSALNKNGPDGRPFVWPASSADNGWETTYADRGNLYMGTLLAIPVDTPLWRTSLPRSGPAYQLARALQDYGAYITDAADTNLCFYAEPAAAEEIPEDFADQLSAILPLLYVVTNNHPTSIGGGGIPRARFAPLISFEQGK
ncbi:MAG: hypothetical protein OES79_14300, partial [Planctomycetota bacterium]|nr:hypothetical protein [Planctomycetota bacterium]